MGYPESKDASDSGDKDESSMDNEATEPPMGEDEMPAAGSYEHLGCFNDNKDDRVLGHRLKSPMMSAEVCYGVNEL